MSASSRGADADDVLEQNLLKSFDKESVAKLLGKKSLVAKVHEDEVPESKRIKLSDKTCENEKISRITSLEDELKTERVNRAHYEEKSKKLARNLGKAEDVIISLKKKIKEGVVQYSSSKLEQMKSKMLLRIGDIEKDTVEMKGLIAAELKNITDIKTPLENVSKLVEYLQSELESRDEKIKTYEKNLIGKGSIDEPVDDNGENRVDETSSSLKNDEKDSTPDKVMKKCNCTVGSEELKKILDENMATIKKLNDDLTRLSSKNMKLKDKKTRIGEDYDTLENYLTKIELKLEKKTSKCDQLRSENDHLKIEIESLNELNENVMEQTRVLKEESVLLKDNIAQKDEKLARVEFQLSLSKEDLEFELRNSFKVKENELRKELICSKRELKSAFMKINNLLQSNHKLSLKVEDLELEQYSLVRNQKAEMKKVNKIHKAACQEISKKLLEKREDIENNNIVVEKSNTQFTSSENQNSNDEEISSECKPSPHDNSGADVDTTDNITAAVVEELVAVAVNKQ